MQPVTPHSYRACRVGGWYADEYYVLDDNRDQFGTDLWSPPTAETKVLRWFLVVPLWATTLMLALYPGVFVNNWLRRRHRRKHGLCLRCGYDLRGSLEAGRCPECGTGFDSQTREHEGREL